MSLQAEPLACTTVVPTLLLRQVGPSPGGVDNTARAELSLLSSDSEWPVPGNAADALRFARMHADIPGCSPQCPIQANAREARGCGVYWCLEYTAVDEDTSAIDAWGSAKKVRTFGQQG